MNTVNPWHKFKGLLPGGSRAVVTVVSVNAAEGVSTVTLRNGSTLKVRGAGVSAGNNALLVDGELRGTVPALPQFSGDL